MKNKIFQYTSKVSGNVLCSQCKRHLLFSVLITYLISKWGTGDINGMGGGGGVENQKIMEVIYLGQKSNITTEWNVMCVCVCVCVSKMKKNLLLQTASCFPLA